MSKDTITVIDNINGRQVKLPVQYPTQGPPVVDIGHFYNELGYFTYAPGFLSTASCHRRVTFSK